MSQRARSDSLRRRKHHEVLLERQPLLDIPGILGGLGGNQPPAASPSPSPSPAPAPAPSPPSQSPSGGGSSSGSGNSGSNGGSTPPASGGSSSAPSAGNGGAASSSGSGTGQGAVVGSSVTVDGGAAAATPAPSAGSTVAGESVVLTTSFSTAGNGSIATLVLPIAAIPSANPFGNISDANASRASAAKAIPTVSVGSTNTGSPANAAGSTSSSSSNTQRIVIPIAVVAGVLALGLLIALILQKQRNSMERQLRRPNMTSKKANLMAASSGALGFTSAGFFQRNRRGSRYHESSTGHGREHRSWLAGDAAALQAPSPGPNRASFDSAGFEGQAHTTEMSNAEHMAAGSISRPHSAYGGSRHYHDPNTPLDAESSQGVHRQSVITGEGGYRTASEDGMPRTHGSFFNHDYNDTTPAGLESEIGHGQYADGAAHAITSDQMLSPFGNGQGVDQRASVAGTEVSVGQAYDGIDLGEDPIVAEADGRPNPHYDGNRVMQHPQLNSSRWSG